MRQKKLKGESGPIARYAKKAAILGAVLVGITVFISCFVVACREEDMGILAAGVLIECVMIPLGALYGFGYAFGMDYVLRWTIGGIHAAATFATIAWVKNKMDSRDWATGEVVLAVLSLFFGICCGWIPGIFRGIRMIREEKQRADFE